MKKDQDVFLIPESTIGFILFGTLLLLSRFL